MAVSLQITFFFRMFTVAAVEIGIDPGRLDIGVLAPALCLTRFNNTVLEGLLDQ
jgi:hypothetical protein